MSILLFCLFQDLETKLVDMKEIETLESELQQKKFMLQLKQLRLEQLKKIHSRVKE